MRTMLDIRQPKARTSGKPIEEKIRGSRVGNATAGQGVVSNKVLCRTVLLNDDSFSYWRYL